VASLAEALTAAPIVLDGGLATQLEAQGHDLSSALWSAQLLLDDPEAIIEAHLAFFAAGARVATTASYQASLDGFAKAGIDWAEGAELIGRSVRLADQARARVDGGSERWIAGSVGPYGAALADGSEYRGDYRLSVRELRAWHRPRLELLIEAGVDVLAVETIPCLAEVEALLAEIDGTGQPAWLSLTCAGELTRAGEPAVEAFAMARDVADIVAVGVNCIDPADAAALVRLAGEASGKPAVVYPNGGEQWDAETRSWTGRSTFEPDEAQDWLANGARLIGGCCRIAPAQIRALAELID
jgi:homocysteine S-methyltransferase